MQREGERYATQTCSLQRHLLDEKRRGACEGDAFKGDRQHDIASWLGVNGGRVADIATGKAHSDVLPADAQELPPPGPYLSGLSAHSAIAALTFAKSALATAKEKIRSLST